MRWLRVAVLVAAFIVGWHVGTWAMLKFDGYGTQAAIMPLRHRVPTVGWQLVAHYCCSGRSCRLHHLSYKIRPYETNFRWSLEGPEGLR